MLSLPKLVAVDTNVALDFAKGIDDVCDAIATIRDRFPHVELLLPPKTGQSSLLTQTLFDSCGAMSASAIGWSR